MNYSSMTLEEKSARSSQFLCKLKRWEIGVFTMCPVRYQFQREKLTGQQTKHASSSNLWLVPSMERSISALGRYAMKLFKCSTWKKSIRSTRNAPTPKSSLNQYPILHNRISPQTMSTGCHRSLHKAYSHLINCRSKVIIINMCRNNSLTTM